MIHKNKESTLKMKPHAPTIFQLFFIVVAGISLKKAAINYFYSSRKT
jgi:hypothetical protein